MSEELRFIVENLPNLVFGFPGHRPGGLAMSLLLATVGVGAGLILGTALGIGLRTPSRWIRVPIRVGVRIIRGIPLVLLLLIVHQFLGNATTPLRSAFVALVLYSSAYLADVVLAGLRAVPVQLVEDAQLLGASRWRTHVSVTLPYGFRVMQPAVTTQAITVFKDTSVVVILGVADLTTTARVALGSDVANSPFWVSTYLTVGALYFVTAFGLSRIALRVERRPSRRHLLSGLG